MRLQFKRFNYHQLFRLSQLNRNNRLGLTPVAKRVSGTWPGCRLHLPKATCVFNGKLSLPQDSILLVENPGVATCRGLNGCSSGKVCRCGIPICGNPVKGGSELQFQKWATGATCGFVMICGNCRKLPARVRT